MQIDFENVIEALDRIRGSLEFRDFEIGCISPMLLWRISEVGRKSDLTNFGILSRGREKEKKKNHRYMQKSDYTSEWWNIILYKKRNEDLT